MKLVNFSEKEKMAVCRILLEVSLIAIKPDKSDISLNSYAYMQKVQQDFELTMEDMQKVIQMKIPDDISFLKNSNKLVKLHIAMFMLTMVDIDVSDLKKRIFNSILSYIEIPDTYDELHNLMSI
ncbi:MAG: hypothetical protein LBE56_08120 [Tannerella sp.]|nr:hypothetical protein [Tannerella sp.]